MESHWTNLDPEMVVRRISLMLVPDEPEEAQLGLLSFAGKDGTAFTLYADPAHVRYLMGLPKEERAKVRTEPEMVIPIVWHGSVAEYLDTDDGALLFGVTAALGGFMDFMCGGKFAQLRDYMMQDDCEKGRQLLDTCIAVSAFFPTREEAA